MTIEIDNLLDTFHRSHYQIVENTYYASSIWSGRRQPIVPATSFIFEFMLYNALYQYDWLRSYGEGRLIDLSEEDRSDSSRQASFEKFMRNRCKENPSWIVRAFAPIRAVNDLNGDWTRFETGPRINAEDGRRFFDKLSSLATLVESTDEFFDIKAAFRLIKECRVFVYRIRNNIFHGTKSIGSITGGQCRRVEVYDIFLKCLISLFFLCVGKSKISADRIQHSIRPFSDSSDGAIGHQAVVQMISQSHMRIEDSRLINLVNGLLSNLVVPDKRSALFYPSASSDLITPILLGLPYCTHFYFYDKGYTSDGLETVWRQKILWLERILSASRKTMFETPHRIGTRETLMFKIGGVEKQIHLVKEDNQDFLTMDVDLVFYFHRGDSGGEGGSGQEWDNKLILKLGKKIAKNSYCHIVTDGKPGGIHPKLSNTLCKYTTYLGGRSPCFYYYGKASGESLRRIAEEESDSRM